MLVSYVFFRSVATYQHMAVVFFAGNGRFSRIAKKTFRDFCTNTDEKVLIVEYLFLFEP